MEYATAFREYEPDAAPSDWTRQWGTAYDALVRHSALESEPRLELSDSSETQRLHSWDVIAADGDRDDVEVLCLVASTNQTGGHTVSRVAVVRGSGGSGTEAGYYVELMHSTDQIRVGRYVAGVATTIDTQAGSASTLRIGSLVWVRFRVNSTTIRARVWDHDAAEPTAWDIDTTDSNVTGVGNVGLISDEPLSCWFFGVGTDGDTAPGKAFLGPSLAELALDPDANIEFVAEVSSRDPDTDVESTRYYSSQPRKTGLNDLPVDQDMESLLLDIGDAAAVIQGDLDRLGGRGATHGSLELNNEPVEPGEARPFSTNETYIGRRVRLRVGEAGKPIRGFTALRTSEANRELEVNEDTATLDLRSALGKMLDRTLEARRYTGIPRCLETLIAHQSRFDVAANSRYDLTEFTIAVRFRQPAGNVELSIKEAATTDRNWRFYTASGQLRCEFSISGTNTVIHQPTESYEDQEWHVAVWAFQAERSYVMVDDQVLDDIEPTGIPDTQSGAQGVRWIGFSPVGTQVQDCRILGTFLDPDAARAQFAARSEGDDPDAVGVWRCDDVSGTSVTDYSSNAAAGTVVGVEDTGFGWEPSDLGDAHLAGKRMPLAYGPSINFQMTLIDFLEERFRLNDRALDNTLDFGDEGTVRTQGVEVDETTDWTDEGDGVIEFVAATVEPVNAGMSPEPAPDNSHQAAELMQRVLTERCGFSSSDFDARMLEGLRRAAPLNVGFQTLSERTAESVVREILSPMGAHYFEDRHGRLTGGLMLDTVPPGPISNTWLEFLGLEESRVYLGQYTGQPGLSGLCCWIYPLGELLDPQADGSTARQTIVDIGGGTSIELDPTTGNLIVSGPGPGDMAYAGIEPSVATFVYLDWESVGAPPTSRLYIGKQGESVRLVAQSTGSSTTITSSDITIGERFVGAIQNVQLYSGTKALADIQDVMDDGTDANLLVDFALDEGEGLTTTEGVSGDQVVVTGARWVPKLTLDLTETNQHIRVESFRRLAPVDRLTLTYAPNFDQMADADFVASATDADRGLLKRPFLEISTRDPNVAADYAETRKVELDSLIYDGDQAQRRQSLIRRRLAPDRKVAEVVKVDRRALELVPADVVRIVDDWHPALAAGWHGRLVALRAGRESWDLDLWG